MLCIVLFIQCIDFLGTALKHYDNQINLQHGCTCFQYFKLVDLWIL